MVQSKGSSHSEINMNIIVFFQNPSNTERPTQVISLTPKCQVVKSKYGKFEVHDCFSPAILTFSHVSPLLQLCNAGTQGHLLMAGLPVSMAQPSPTPLFILVWKAISSQAYLHANAWLMAHGLALLQTAQVSIICTEYC